MCCAVLASPSRNVRTVARTWSVPIAATRCCTRSSRMRSSWWRDSEGALSASASARCASCQRPIGTRSVIQVLSGPTSTSVVPPSRWIVWVRLARPWLTSPFSTSVAAASSAVPGAPKSVPPSRPSCSSASPDVGAPSSDSVTPLARRPCSGAWADAAAVGAAAPGAGAGGACWGAGAVAAGAVGGGAGGALHEPANAAANAVANEPASAVRCRRRLMAGPRRPPAVRRRRR